MHSRAPFPTLHKRKHKYFPNRQRHPTLKRSRTSCWVNWQLLNILKQRRRLETRNTKTGVTKGRNIVSFFDDIDLKLLVADKTGGFVGTPGDIYAIKPREAVYNNVEQKPEVVPATALCLSTSVFVVLVSCRPRCFNMFNM